MAGVMKSKFAVDDDGKAVSVLLYIKAYRKMLVELEELEGIRAYDSANASVENPVRFEKAIAEIDKPRK